MQILEEEKKNILNYLFYAQFFVSKYLNSVNRIPNIMIDTSDLKSSIQFMENSIKKVIRYINNPKKTQEEIHNIYLASNKQFIYLISLMQSEWSKEYIGLNNALTKLSFKKFNQEFNQKDQQKFIKDKKHTSGTLRTFIWRVIVAHQLLLETARILEIPIDERDYIDIIKELNFPKEYTQIGISILNYFGEIIIERYANIDISVSIQQLKHKVIMVINTPNTYQEIIEQDLYDYGQVVLGYDSIDKFSKNSQEFIKLTNKLELVQLEIKNINKLLLSEKEKNILLIQQIKQQDSNLQFMQELFSNEKKEKTKLLELIKKMNKALTKKEQIYIDKLLKVIDSNDKALLRNEIENIKNNEPNLLGKINELIIKGGIQGASGNYFFALLQELSKFV